MIREKASGVACDGCQRPKLFSRVPIVVADKPWKGSCPVGGQDWGFLVRLATVRFVFVSHETSFCIN